MLTRSKLDKQLYDNEIASQGLEEGEFIKKRRGLVSRLKDMQKSGKTKAQWRTGRWKIMRGIKRFHRSTEGKRFHRQLGRFLATRDTDKGILSYRESKELVQCLSSALTYGFLELDYYIPTLNEDVDYNVFLDELYDEVTDLFLKLKSPMENLDEQEEFLYRLCESSELIKAFADKHSKSVEEVEDLWNKAKEIVKKEYDKTEDDDEFYKLVVGVIKKMLGE